MFGWWLFQVLVSDTPEESLACCCNDSILKSNEHEDSMLKLERECHWFTAASVNPTSDIPNKDVKA